MRQRDQALLYTMASDGTRLRIVSDSLQLRGEPAWEPDGRFVIYPGPDVGTKFSAMQQLTHIQAGL